MASQGSGAGDSPSGPSHDLSTAGTADALIDHASARQYWQGIDADVSGMLGGFPYVSRADLQGSKNFLARLGVGNRKRPGSRRAAAAAVTTAAAAAADAEPSATSQTAGQVLRVVDCGAGIGRISRGLLLPLANVVDVVEPIAKFTAELRGLPGIGDIFNVGLEEWTPVATSRYDLIWNQWCLGHLTDVQLEAYLARCRTALADGGLIIVKENLSTAADDVFDAEDSSVTRTDDKFRAIFARAALTIKRTELQKGFPRELYPVCMYALVPSR